MARDGMRWHALHTILLLVFLHPAAAPAGRSHQKNADEHRGDKPAAA
jgi:hypothetical protein